MEELQYPLPSADGSRSSWTQLNPLWTIYFGNLNCTLHKQAIPFLLWVRPPQKIWVHPGLTQLTQNFSASPTNAWQQHPQPYCTADDICCKFNWGLCNNQACRYDNLWYALDHNALSCQSQGKPPPPMTSQKTLARMEPTTQWPSSNLLRTQLFLSTITELCHYMACTIVPVHTVTLPYTAFISIESVLYPYTNDLALEAIGGPPSTLHLPLWVLSQLLNGSSSCSRILIPGVELHFWLQIGFNHGKPLRSASQNLGLVNKNTSIVSQYIEEEVASGKLCIHQATGIAPIGLIPKCNQHGRFGLIVDLSSPPVQVSMMGLTHHSVPLHTRQ